MLSSISSNRIFRAKLGICWFFLNLGMLVGNYVSRLPSIKLEHRLTDGELGLVLLVCAMGTMLCLPLVGRITASFGSGMPTFMASIGSAVVLPLIGINDMTTLGQGSLVTGMFSIGFGMGIADVSTNAQAVIVEAQTGKPQMGLFHAAYAIGSFVGALIAGSFAEAGISPFTNIFIVSAGSMLLSLFFLPTLYTYAEEKEALKRLESTSRRLATYDSNSKSTVEKKGLLIFGMNRSLFFISLIGFLAYMAEGSIEDWTTVYYTEALKASPMMCSIGFAVFSLAIAIGRFLSDGLVQRFGSIRLLQVSGTVAAAGLALVVFAPSMPADLQILTATVALGISGSGLSIASPIVSSSAGRVSGMLPADALSFVTSFGYSGYFIGPPLFGGLAEALGGLRWSLLVDAMLIFIIALSASQIPEDAQFKEAIRKEDYDSDSLMNVNGGMLEDQ